jgi:hypothetical protein
VLVQTAFCLFAKSMTEKKTTKRGLCGSHKKDRASHEVRMVGIFYGWGFCPAALPVIILQAKPDRIIIFFY